MMTVQIQMMALTAAALIDLRCTNGLFLTKKTLVKVTVTLVQMMMG